MKMFKELNHVSITVTDVAKAREFYTGVLGLEEIPRPAFNFPGIWYGLGNGLSLHIILNDELVRPAVERETILARYGAFRPLDGRRRRDGEAHRGARVAVPGRRVRADRPPPGLREGPRRQHGGVHRPHRVEGSRPPHGVSGDRVRPSPEDVDGRL